MLKAQDMAYVYCAIEGNIAAGKSTMLEYLSTICEDMQSFQTIREPVELFTVFRAHNPLKRMYECPLREGALVQDYLSKVLSQFYKIEFEKANKPCTKYVISDRSMSSCNVFLEAMYHEQILSSFQYDYLRAKNDSYEDKLPKPMKIFFLDTPADVCFMRIQERSRPGEQHCSLSYLLALERAYRSYVEEFRKQNGPDSVIQVCHNDLGEAARSLVEFVKATVNSRVTLGK